MSARRHFRGSPDAPAGTIPNLPAERLFSWAGPRDPAHRLGPRIAVGGEQGPVGSSLSPTGRAASSLSHFRFPIEQFQRGCGAASSETRKEEVFVP